MELETVVDSPCGVIRIMIPLILGTECFELVCASDGLDWVLWERVGVGTRPLPIYKVYVRLTVIVPVDRYEDGNAASWVRFEVRDVMPLVIGRANESALVRVASARNWIPVAL